jgi:uncharacterized protein with PIN domain
VKVSVPCPRCGRDYDVALFQFGRTIDCSCGYPVGLEPRVRRARAGAEIRFIADAMLGRLARWLRTLGCDTEFEAEIRDAELARRGIEEERAILTRDRRFPEEWRVPCVLVLESQAPLDQLREVARAFDLDAESRLFTRCSRCNSSLDAVTPDQVASQVPQRVLLERSRFARCPSCGRVYWEGSHTARMRRLLTRALPDAVGIRR